MKTGTSLERIIDSGCCSGCGLCASLAPESLEMRLSEGGYLRPQLKNPLSAAKDTSIAELCPGTNIILEPDGVPNHTLWGPIVACRTGHAADVELRHHASSGGVLSALGQYLLDSGEVDWILQIKASDEIPIGNAVSRSRNNDDVFAAAGSRYAPSAPLENLMQYLDGAGRFAVIAKPCDIAAIRNLARQDPRVKEKIPYLLSFFCAGIPSVKGARRVVEELGLDPDDISSFRYRGDGWPGFATAVTKSGEERRMNYADSWGNILSKHVQFRCKICPDGTGGLADIVCGDAWHCDENGYPLFSELEGSSLILSRTRRGEALLTAATAQGHVRHSPLDIAQLSAMQPSQAQRKTFVLSRLAGLAIVRRMIPRFRNLRLVKASRGGGLLPNLKSMLGSIRRLIKRRAAR